MSPRGCRQSRRDPSGGDESRFFPASALTRSGARVRSLPAQPSIACLYLRPRQPDPRLPPASRSKAPSAPPFPLSLAPPLGLDGTHAGGGAPSARLRSAPRAGSLRERTAEWTVGQAPVRMLEASRCRFRAEQARAAPGLPGLRLAG